MDSNRKEKERKTEKYLEEESKASNGWQKSTGRRLLRQE
jgi:hypothetical protein